MFSGMNSLLAQSLTAKPPFPPSLIFNEGWLLRFILNWCAQHAAPGLPLTPAEQATWYSEALLPTPFQARYKHDPHAEARTHADGLVGHFGIRGGKTGCVLAPGATQLIVLEAKMFSSLSAGVKNAPYYDQAARSVACMAELCRRAERNPSDIDRLAFIVAAPRAQIGAGLFDADVNMTSIDAKVQRRIAGYDHEKEEWYGAWFRPLLERIEISVHSWEELLDGIADVDDNSAAELRQFYHACLKYNGAPSAQGTTH